MKVRLDQLVVQRGLVTSRNRARTAILEGKIQVDGQLERRPGAMVPSDAQLSVDGPLMTYVSRGALKLERAIEAFGIDVAGRICLDVGASTGGFTQVLLERGAALVFAVDVGRDQLHASLRGDPRVLSLEGVNIRDLAAEALNPRPSLAVIDVSFISLRLVLPEVARLVERPAVVVSLVKPQFEVGRERLGKGGIVRDPRLRSEAVDGVVQAALAAGYTYRDRCDSPITGGDGNHEVLLHLQLE